MYDVTYADYFYVALNVPESELRIPFVLLCIFKKVKIHAFGWPFLNVSLPRNKSYLSSQDILVSWPLLAAPMRPIVSSQ
jgi:hypothetical protein